jgi:hypothetical protein
MLDLCQALPLQGSFSLRECRLFLYQFKNKRDVSYLEYGAGTSTLIAGLRAKRAVSVEGSREWFLNTSLKLQKFKLNKTVQMRYANIGPTARLSYPMWSNASALEYCAKPLWGSEAFDLVLIDGRFRVACAAHVYARLNHGATLLVHDYRHRTHYSDINRLYSLVGIAETLAVFKRKPNKNPLQIFRKHFYDAA